MVNKPGKHQRSKQIGEDLCWKVLDTAHLLFYVHWLCMNYIVAIPLLVSCLSSHNHPLYFARFCAGSTPKIAYKNIHQISLSGFITIPSINYDQAKLGYMLVYVNVWMRTTHGQPCSSFISPFSFHSVNINTKLIFTLIKNIKKETTPNFVLTLNNTF